MTTLVTGARGNVGARVLRRLQAAGRPVRAASRTPGGLAVAPGTPTVTLDLTDPATHADALADVERVFLYAEPAGVTEFLTAAVAAGVGHVVLLSSETVELPDAATDPLARHHAVVEDALTGSGLAWTILRPGAFAGNAAGWAGPIGQGAVVDQPFAESQVAPVHEDDIADVAVAALTGDELHGRIVTLTGPESLTFREEIGTIASLLGRDVAVRDLDRAEAERTLAGRIPPPVLTSLLDQWGAGVGRPAPTRTCESITGRPARTFRQWASENLALFDRSAA
jgi:uncharacterized protein YbjT (DUF2867 family)